MVTICAWCHKFLGLKEPLAQAEVSHGICRTCSDRQLLEDIPTLVVSRSRVDTLPVLQGLLQGTPEIRIVVDRRKTRGRGAEVGFAVPVRGRARRRERRAKLSLFLA